MKTKTILIVPFFIAFKFSFSQPLVDWQLVGNALTGVEIFGATSGAFPLNIQTAPAQTQPINFFTAPAQRCTSKRNN